MGSRPKGPIHHLDKALKAFSMNEQPPFIDRSLSIHHVGYRNTAYLPSSGGGPPGNHLGVTTTLTIENWYTHGWCFWKWQENNGKIWIVYPSGLITEDGWKGWRVWDMVSSSASQASVWNMISSHAFQARNVLYTRGKQRNLFIGIARCGLPNHVKLRSQQLQCKFKLRPIMNSSNPFFQQ